MAAVVSLAWEHNNAIFQKYAFMVTPTKEIGQVVCAYDKCEIVFRFQFFECIQSVDCILRGKHLEFDVNRLHFQFRMTRQCSQCSLIAVLPGWKAMALFERVLRSDYQVYYVKTRFLCKETDYGLMAFVEGVETTGIDGYVHRFFASLRMTPHYTARKASTILSASL